MNPVIQKPATDEYATFYQKYIDHAPFNDIIPELIKQVDDFKLFIQSIPDTMLQYRYAEGKWTVAEVLQHLIDSERIFGFRVLNFVRNGMMEIPGFDQDAFAKRANTSMRTKESFINEFEAVRKGTTEFLKSITPDQSLIIGKANNYAVSVRAIAYIIYGHIVHHQNVITEKYL